MLYCMAFTHSEIENLNDEICRVLKKEAINIYTVRNYTDADYTKEYIEGKICMK